MSGTIPSPEVPVQNGPVMTPALALTSIKKAISEGDCLQAIGIAENVLNDKELQIDRPTSVLLQQQFALALARSGFTDRAKVVLSDLLASGAVDSETYGLLGSVYKILWSKEPVLAERAKLLNASRDYYRTGFEKTQAPYCGVNAASLSVLLNDEVTAKTLAESAREKVGQSDNFWDLATVAEANLVLGHIEEARSLYSRAATAAGQRWSDIGTIRKQCRLLCFKLQGRRELLDGCFPATTVGFFSGHVTDGPGTKPRFPPSAVPSVEERIRNWLTSKSVRFAYSSAAWGGDIIFLEIAQSLKVDTHVLLPFTEEYFIQTSVAQGGEDWVERFKKVIAKATSKTILSDDAPEYHSSAFDFANRMIPARAVAHASVNDSPLLGLSVWNGEISETVGGTSYALAYWGRRKMPISIINPMEPSQDRLYDADVPPLEVPFPRLYTANPVGVQTAVVSMLLLRINGYQAMREKDFERFFQDMLGALSQSMATNKWFPARYGFGGEYFFVWENVCDAGTAAVTFMALLEAGRSNCPPEVNFSICLHSAPVQMIVNPVLNQYTHEGAAVSNLRALSENLGPGIIYATETFASLAAFEKASTFRCEYSGKVGVSKDSTGTRVYQVRK
jgi:adenylate cyclase